MKKPFLIGICGGSGSGKTSFIKKLRERFPESDVSIVSQDDYYFPRSKQEKDEKGIENFDLPDSIDKKKLRQDIHSLMEGNTLTFKEYVFNNDEAIANTITIKPAPIIIVEGLFVFHYKKLAQLFDLKVYIHAKDNLKVIRRIYRDQVERNYPIDDVLYRYQHHVLPAYEAYILPYKEMADVIINNNDHFKGGLEIFCGYIDSKLAQYKHGV